MRTSSFLLILVSFVAEPATVHGQICESVAWYTTDVIEREDSDLPLIATDSSVTLDFGMERIDYADQSTQGANPTFSDWDLVDTLLYANLSTGAIEVTLPYTVEVVGFGSVSIGPNPSVDLVQEFDNERFVDSLAKNNGKIKFKNTSGGKLTNVVLHLGFPPEVCTSVKVTDPKEDELVIADRDYTIRWTSREVENVIVSFSADSTNNFRQVAVVPADSQKYVWSVPDTLTRKAYIRLEDLSGGAEPDTSDMFKVKGYVLTRVDDNDDYEAFEAGKHDWSFKNDYGNLDPPTYADTDQFGYFMTGDDPFTSDEYDPVFYTSPVQSYATDFPDWPSTVRAFGTDDFYWGSPLFGIYHDEAVTYWHQRISGGSPWSGSCAGMAVTALLAFADKQTFGGEYPDIGVVDELYSVVPAAGPVSDPVREVINELFTKQWSQAWDSHYQIHRSDTPRETLETLKPMLLDEDESHAALATLYISNAGMNSMAHSVSAIELIRTSESPNQWDLTIYDPNHPNTTRTIKIDSTANTWSYPLSGYNGSGAFFVVDPANSYYFEAVRAPATSSKDIERPTTTSKQTIQSPMRIYPTPWASVDITSEDGTTGYSDSATVNSIPGADFFLAATGYVSSPVYYELPEGSYGVELSDSPDSVLSLHVAGEGPAITYARFDASADQTDHLSVGRGVGVANRDAATKSIYFKTIFVFADQERTMEIRELDLEEGDSTYVVTEEDGMLRLENHGNAGTYDLVLRRADVDTVIRYHSVRVPIGEGARHRIPPDWDNLDTEPVEIEVDADGDGTYEGSMSVKNNVAVEDLGVRSDELPTRFELKQNYPNPFNPSTTIAYDVPSRSHVQLTVYDALGRAVATLVDEERTAGRHMITWDAGGASSGVYFYRLEAGTIVQTRSMFLAK